ncbi:SLC13 family permease [bacterium]|nr:SLC13 family permease [candidate division CSSED10-310 bacterium]
MILEAWITLLVLTGVLILLISTRRNPEMILLGGLIILLVTGVLPASKALAGFANEGMITVGALFILSAALRETGGIQLLTRRLLTKPGSLLTAQMRVVFPSVLLSGFLNNTPLVAILLPAVKDWAKKYHLPISKLLIPLSYSAILGGLCTLIGTSTNLIVNGLLIESKIPSLGFFEITRIGIPCAIAGTLFILMAARWMIPDRQPVMNQLDNPREYTIEMIVEPGSPLVDQTLENAGLRNLPEMYVMEIERDGQIIPAVSSQHTLRADDRLVFVGVVESVVDLQKIRGLKPATDQVFKLDAPRSDRCLIEAVVSNTNPLTGKTIREGRFRTKYDAAIIAVARNGMRIKRKIGDIVLEPGDTLMLETLPEFEEKQRNSRDFYLVSRLEDSNPPRHDRAWTALAILIGMIVSVTAGWFSMLQASLLAGGLLFLTGCCSAEAARKAVDTRLLLAIASALGIGKALETSGAALAFADFFLKLAGNSPWLSLLIVYFITMIFTELITNNAAAVLMFPVAQASAQTLDVNFMPFVIAIMVAASASFSSPIGYQTNLMVYGPGGYHFSDFARMGAPLGILVGIITVTLVPFLWPF